MPQASDELRAKFPDWDAGALEVLRENFTVDRGGCIHPKIKGYKPSQHEYDAIDYLFQEWDYGYLPEPIV